MEENTSIRIRDIKQAILENRRKLMLIIGGLTVAALLLSLILPAKYESTVLLRVNSQKPTSVATLQSASALSALGLGGLQDQTKTFIEIIESRRVLEPVIASLDFADDIDHVKFAKKYVDTKNPKGTDLIEIKAYGRTAEEAHTIASRILASFIDALTQINQTEQSLLLKFLSDRVKLSKIEMESAEREFEAYRQQEKLFLPTEQAKAVIDKIGELDKKASETKVMLQTNNVKLKSLNEHLANQNMAIARYQITDNPELQQIRTALFNKQLALLELQMKYKDEHPMVKKTKEELDRMAALLSNQVSQSIKAGTATLNPIHANLLGQKVAVETESIMLAVQEQALGQVMRATEDDIRKLSSDSLNYVSLERKVRTTQEVYGTLVRSYEQARVQEAMESMDVKVIDQANRPKKPAFPQVPLMTGFGFVLGIFACMGYLTLVLKDSATNSPGRDSH